MQSVSNKASQLVLQKLDILLFPVCRSLSPESNYSYIIECVKTKKCLFVDPLDAKGIIKAAKSRNLTPVGSLTTHAHWDHDGGNKFLRSHFGRDFPIYGGIGDNVNECNNPVRDGDTVDLLDTPVRVMSIPCHTIGHVAYVIDDFETPLIFTGDTLFVAGCGNFNKGTPSQMVDNFLKIYKLGENTLVYCGHEYTRNNLLYARHVLGERRVIRQKLMESNAANFVSVPSTIKEELDSNPFLLAALGDEYILQYTNSKCTSDAMWYLRREKSRGSWKS